MNLRDGLELFTADDPAAPAAALDIVTVWLERDDGELAVAFADELAALFCERGLSWEEKRVRLRAMLNYLACSLEQAQERGSF
jgi:hypothetical protein